MDTMRICSSSPEPLAPNIRTRRGTGVDIRPGRHAAHETPLRMAVTLLAGLLAAELNAQSFSSLVYPDGEGRLVYTGYANQGQTNAINTIPDFSSCGYAGGGQAIPFVAEVRILDPVAGDDGANIQNAINEVAALPVQTNGFRGAVLLRAGTYEVSNTLFIQTSGIVIRGEGQQESGGTKILFTATVQDDLFEVLGPGSPSEVGGTRVSISDAFVPVGAVSFRVVSTAGYRVGDRIMVRRLTNDRWIDELGMRPYGWEAPYYEDILARTITALAGNTVTINAPIVQAIETQYGGGAIYKFTHSGAITNIGLEHLRLESTYASSTDENHGWTAVEFQNTENAWVRQVTARHFGNTCVSVVRNSRYVTVEDCAQLDPKSEITGGNRYSFNLDDCSYVLVQRCYARGGRHDYATGSRTFGPNAFVDCLAEQTYADIGPHHRYAIGLLFDNVKGGEINVQNRASSGTGHGWAGAQTLFWNCESTSMICDAPLAAMNYSIGCFGIHAQGQWVPEEPDGIWESHWVHVTPRSLYYAQLADRLGTQAVAEVTIAAQCTGTIWGALSAWAGEGRTPGVPPIVRPFTVSAGPDQRIGSTVAALAGVVSIRDASLTVTTLWTQVAGPGSVVFLDPRSAETTATFPGLGDYRLRLTAYSESFTNSDEVAVSVDQPAAILVQPQPQAIWPGSNATFSVTVLGGGPVAYQWRKDGRDIPGATGPTLTLDAVTVSDDAWYEVVVTDPIGSVVSQAVRLTVLVVPAFVTQPRSQEVPLGGTVTLFVETTGTLPITFIWRRAGIRVATEVLDSHLSFFTITNFHEANVYPYYNVAIQNAAQSYPAVVSDVFGLTLGPPILDSDGDGMPDAFENAHPDLDPHRSADAGWDGDGDGQTNWEEFVAGTDHTDGSSCLKVEAIGANGGARIRFTALTNKFYTVQWRWFADHGAWNRLADVVPRETNRVVELIDPAPKAEGSQRFYRLVTPRVP